MNYLRALGVASLLALYIGCATNHNNVDSKVKVESRKISPEQIRLERIVMEDITRGYAPRQ